MGSQRVKDKQLAVTLRLQALSDPEIQSYLSSVKAKYGKYLVSVEQGRKIIDQAMGKRSLTELLYASREQEPV